ncbi:glycoside hydrolase family 38 C-terminal domain-containing protein, partial [Candidatus Hydrogenedentota bacterium]
KSGFKWLHSIRFGRKDVKLPCHWEGIDGTRIMMHAKEYAHNSWEYAALENTLKVFQNLRNVTKFVLQGEDKGWEVSQPPWYLQKNKDKNLWYEPVSEEEVPSWHIAECLKKFNEQQDEFEFRFGLPREYFRALEGEVKKGRKLPLFDGEMNPEFTGCYTTRHWLKQTNRLAEAALLTAESLATICYDLGQKYPQKDLLHAWRRLCYTHHHDGITGCHIDVIENDIMRYYGEVLDISKKITEKGLALLARKVDTRGPGKNPVVIYNPMSWKRTSVAVVNLDIRDVPFGEGLAVTDAAGNMRPVIAEKAEGKKVALKFLADDIPSMGYKVFHLVTGEKVETALRKGPNFIENEFYRVEVTNKGVSRIYDKELKREVIDSTVGFGNELVCEEDTGDVYVGTYSGREVSSYNAKTKVTKISETGFKATIFIKGRFPNLPWLDKSELDFEQEIRLYAGLKRIDFVTNVDWKGHQTRLSVKFPTTVKTDTSMQSIPYGAIERKPYEARALTQDLDWPAMTWVGIDNGKFGVTLLNRGTPGNKVEDGVMTLNLMRSPLIGGYLTSPWPADLAKAHGKHTFKYSIVSHKGDSFDSLAFRRGFELKHGLVGIAAKSHAGALPTENSYLTLDSPNVVATVLKRAEEVEKGIVVRAFEATGKPTEAKMTFSKSFESMHEVDMIEDDLPRSRGRKGDKLKVKFGKFDIRTFMLE